VITAPLPLLFDIISNSPCEPYEVSGEGREAPRASHQSARPPENWSCWGARGPQRGAKGMVLPPPKCLSPAALPAPGGRRPRAGERLHGPRVRGSGVPALPLV